MDFAKGDLPTNWTPQILAGSVNRVGVGGFSRQFSVDQTRAYDLSIAGNFPGRLILLFNGAQIYSGHTG